MNSAKERTLREVFMEHGYEGSYMDCRYDETSNGDYRISGNLCHYDVLETTLEKYEDIEDIEDMEILLSESYDIHIRITDGECSLPSGKAWGDEIAQYQADNEEQRNKLSERLHKAVERLEEIIGGEIKIMEEEIENRLNQEMS